MKDTKLESSEKKRMLEFTQQALGSIDKDWTDREILVNYNKALAMFIVAASRNAKK